MRELEASELRDGVKLFLQHLDELIEKNPEIADLHDAFENFSMNKYSNGDSSTTQKTGKKKDCGIDFYSYNDLDYIAAQCKIPEKDYLEAHPDKIKLFGDSPISDARDALNYLFKESKVKPNDLIKHLYTLISSDRNKEGFNLIFFIIVFGKLNERALSAFEELQKEYSVSEFPVKIVLQQIDDIVDDFLIGASKSNEKLNLE